MPNVLTTDAPLQQIKQCPFCLTLVEPTPALYLLEADAIVCTGCREKGLSVCLSAPPSDNRTHILNVNSDIALPLISLQNKFVPEEPTSGFEEIVQSSEPLHASAQNTYHSVLPPPTKLAPSVVSSTTPASVHPHPHITAALSRPTNPLRRNQAAISSPDPLTDITRLRVRSYGHHCLYPGASFQGTQKSGRNSYDVNVTIVDVDFSSSFLCGYLRIRGLTDDWPELTTYFDAEIIGSRHGFLTRNWGASEHEDLVHWSRFPAFKHVRHEAKRPNLTIEDRDRGAVFMRWKERFLVPDHRVQDINGASFAGFYYVCVDFNPSNPSSTSDDASSSEAGEMDATAPKLDNTRRLRRASSVRRRAPTMAPISPPAATMSGFYYHQNSEPYQQLSLCHVPERLTSNYEFR